MTAPADVWAVENPSGKLWSDHDGAPLMWASRELASRARGKRDKVVRFRLVRVDEPEQPQRDEVGELRECVRELSSIVRELVFGRPRLMHRVMHLCASLSKSSEGTDG